LKLRSLEAKALTLMIIQEEEWGIHASKKEIIESPELTIRF
jgi:hypothetical protein